MTDRELEERTLKAAAFLAQALDLGDPPAALAADLSPIEDDPASAVYATELESSVGPAAFLIYAYDLSAADRDGGTGRDRFVEALATLETAARVEAPGPRALAHAETETDGFILATSPAVFRALAGEGAGADPVATQADLLRTGDPVELRNESALELLRLLRLADQAAAAWLGTVAASGQEHPAIEFSAEETELSLFLLDDRSIRQLLTALKTILEAAQGQAAGGPEDGAP